MLECCESLESVREHGISMRKLACIGRCNGAKVTLHRMDDGGVEQEGMSVETLRDFIKQVTSHKSYIQPPSSPEDGVEGETLEEYYSFEPTFMLINYNRTTFLQTGSGHFSPVGGYDPVSDHVLIMDVATFKYPMHWVPLSLLHASLCTKDSTTGRSRGFLVFSSPPTQPLIFLFPPSLSSSWSHLVRIFQTISQAICDAVC